MALVFGIAGLACSRTDVRLPETIRVDTRVTAMHGVPALSSPAARSAAHDPWQDAWTCSDLIGPEETLDYGAFGRGVVVRRGVTALAVERRTGRVLLGCDDGRLVVGSSEGDGQTMLLAAAVERGTIDASGKLCLIGSIEAIPGASEEPGPNVGTLLGPVVHTVAFDGKGEAMLAAAGEVIQVWDRSGRPRTRIAGHRLLALSDDACCAAVVRSSTGTEAYDGPRWPLSLIDPWTGAVLVERVSEVGEDATVAVGRSGRTIAIADRNRVELLDVATGHRRQIFEDLPVLVGMMRFHPDGDTLALGFFVGQRWFLTRHSTRRHIRDALARMNHPSVLLYSFRTRRARLLEGVWRSPVDLKFSPDGRRIAVVTNNGRWTRNRRVVEVAINDVATGALVDGAAPHGAGSVEFAANGHDLLLGMRDHEVVHWRPHRGP